MHHIDPEEARSPSTPIHPNLSTRSELRIDIPTITQLTIPIVAIVNDVKPATVQRILNTLLRLKDDKSVSLQLAREIYTSVQRGTPLAVDLIHKISELPCGRDLSLGNSISRSNETISNSHELRLTVFEDSDNEYAVAIKTKFDAYSTDPDEKRPLTIEIIFGNSSECWQEDHYSRWNLILGLAEDVASFGDQTPTAVANSETQNIFALGTRISVHTSQDRNCSHPKEDHHITLRPQFFDICALRGRGLDLDTGGVTYLTDKRVTQLICDLSREGIVDIDVPDGEARLISEENLVAHGDHKLFNDGRFHIRQLNDFLLIIHPDATGNEVQSDYLKLVDADGAYSQIKGWAQNGAQIWRAESITCNVGSLTCVGCSFQAVTNVVQYLCPALSETDIEDLIRELMTLEADGEATLGIEALDGFLQQGVAVNAFRSLLISESSEIDLDCEQSETLPICLSLVFPASNPIGVPIELSLVLQKPSEPYLNNLPTANDPTFQTYVLVVSADEIAEQDFLGFTNVQLEYLIRLLEIETSNARFGMNFMPPQSPTEALRIKAELDFPAEHCDE